MFTIRRERTTSAAPAVSGTRPVMLATFNVPFEPAAAEVAVDAAVESGQPLVVVNVAETPILPVSMRLGYEYLEAHSRARHVPALAFCLDDLRLAGEHG